MTSSSGTMDQVYKVTDYVMGRDNKAGPDGLTYSYYSNGAKYTQEFYKRGKLQGQRVVWYPNGKVQTVEQYNNGNLHGEMKRYDEEGNLTEHQRYENSKMVEDLMK
jgi:antitoxin component YwqK of YwqJK toxin-antitoxin module